MAPRVNDANKRGVNEIMVIGGSDVFEAAMSVADRLEITRVHASPQGDSYFPAIDPAVWRAVESRTPRARAAGRVAISPLQSYVQTGRMKAPQIAACTARCKPALRPL